MPPEDGSPSAAPSSDRLEVNRATPARQTSSSSLPLLKPARQSSGQAYHPVHPGCVLCGVVASAASQSGSVPPSPMDTMLSLPSPVRAATPDLQRAGGPSSPFRASLSSPLSSPRLNPHEPMVGGHRIVYRDDDITIYPAEGKEALCSGGRHLIVVINRHLTSIYDLGTNDIPILSKMIVKARKILLGSVPASASQAERGFTAKDVRIGFVNGMPADPRSPYPHLHAQAFLGPFDKNLPGSTLWRRNVVFSYLNWWALEDLRAEIREETSNNRVKSGYDDRDEAPIEKVPDAGAVAGLPNALDPDAYADGPTSRADGKRPETARQDSVQSMATVRAESPSKISAEGSRPALRPPHDYRSSVSTIDSASTS